MHKILVIDDDEGVRDAFMLALEGENYDICVAENGEHGLSIAEKELPDLVFLDIRMPGIDGIETLRRLHDIYNDLNIYIVTAFYYDYLEPLASIAEEGFSFEILQKPVGAEQIRQITASVLDKPDFV
jgi:CheY-like chemotaxis protein